MARLLVVSRSMALAMRLADVHEVIEHPVEAIDQVTPGAEVDVVVLDVGEPAAAIYALDRLRATGDTTPVLIVSGYQPAWAGLVAVDLPDVVVVPLPITRAALLDGVADLAGNRSRSHVVVLPAEPAASELAFPELAFPELAFPELAFPDRDEPEPEEPAQVELPALQEESSASWMAPFAKPVGWSEPATWAARSASASAASAASVAEAAAETAAEIEVDAGPEVEAEVDHLVEVARAERPVALPPPLPNRDDDTGWERLLAPEPAPAPVVERWTPVAEPAAAELPVLEHAPVHTAADHAPPPEAEPPSAHRRRGGGALWTPPWLRRTSLRVPALKDTHDESHDQDRPSADGTDPAVLFQPAPWSEAESLWAIQAVAEPETPAPVEEDEGEEAAGGAAGPELFTRPMAPQPPPLPPSPSPRVLPPPLPLPTPSSVAPAPRTRSLFEPPSIIVGPAMRVSPMLPPPLPPWPTPVEEPEAVVDAHAAEPPGLVDAADDLEDAAPALRRRDTVEPAMSLGALDTHSLILPFTPPRDVHPGTSDNGWAAQNFDWWSGLPGHPSALTDSSTVTAAEEEAPQPEDTATPEHPTVAAPDAEAPPVTEPDAPWVVPPPLPVVAERVGEVGEPVAAEQVLEPARLTGDVTEEVTDDVSVSGLQPDRGGSSLALLVSGLTERIGGLFGVADTAQALADEIVERAHADAAAVLVPDGGVWRVSGGVGLRPLERRLVLDGSHWLVSEIALGGRALLVEDSDVVRTKLAGAPLAAWRHLLAVPLPEVRAAVVLARGYEAGAFTEGDLGAVVEPVREGAALLRAALQTRHLARLLAPLREVDLSH